MIEFLSRAHVKGGKALLMSKLVLLLVVFPSDGEASMAVNGLIVITLIIMKYS